MHEQVSEDMTAPPPYGSGGDRSDKWGHPSPYTDEEAKG